MASLRVRVSSMLSSLRNTNAWRGPSALLRPAWFAIFLFATWLGLTCGAAAQSATRESSSNASDTTSPSPSAVAEAAPAIVWEPLTEGLEATHFQVASGGLLSSYAVAVRASSARFIPRSIRAAEYGWKKASAQALCKASGASVCINSNFFDEQGKPLGVVISRGIQHQKVHNGGGTLTGVFFVTSDSVAITHRSLFSAEKVLEAAQAGPRLISQGAPVVGVKDSSSATNISLVCINQEQSVILMRVSLAMFGGSLTELQSVLLRPELGCVEALNFDGGGSSQLYISGGISGHEGATREEFLPGRDEIPVVLGLFSRR
jgi:uncharacterized protein YigE (DUF2233 family)